VSAKRKDGDDSQMSQDHEFKALILYWSASGNTEKVANTIKSTLEQAAISPEVKKITDMTDEDLYSYDLVFLGAPSYQFQPPDPVLRFVKNKMKLHGDRGDIKPGAPQIPGKKAVVFCTYSGPHTGIREATPVGEYLGQFFEHLGFEVVAKWYTVGEFRGREDISTKGRLGDIRGRPNQQDLAEVENNIKELIKSLQLNS
jgi:flavodoxin